jgi:hypothetical protein
MSDWLNRLHALIEHESPGEFPASKAASAPARLKERFREQDPCDNSDIVRRSYESPPQRHTTSQTSQACSPSLNAEGVPCGGCPECNHGEFWRWPKFHKDHDPNGWICWFCSPPPHGSGPCDFCGVPDQMLKRSTDPFAGL